MLLSSDRFSFASLAWHNREAPETAGGRTPTQESELDCRQKGPLSGAVTLLRPTGVLQGISSMATTNMPQYVFQHESCFRAACPTHTHVRSRFPQPHRDQLPTLQTPLSQTSPENPTHPPPHTASVHRALHGRSRIGYRPTKQYKRHPTGSPEEQDHEE